MRKEPTKKELREAFDYCDERGALIWKNRGRMTNKPAGRKHYRNGYIDIGFNCINYGAHRMIWIWHNGSIPKNMVIDHINGIVDDNKISNLQLCGLSDNNRKRSISINNTSGVTGVCWHESRNAWVASMKVNSQLIYIGSSKDKQEAIDMRLKAEKEAFGDFAPSNHAYTGQPTGEFNDSDD